MIRIKLRGKTLVNQNYLNLRIRKSRNKTQGANSPELEEGAGRCVHTRRDQAISEGRGVRSLSRVVEGVTGVRD